MLEATLSDAVILKRLLDSIKELVTDANFECDEEGLKLQAMDNSHVALVSVKMDPDAFEGFRCDRPMPLGVNLGSLAKVLKCAKDDDKCTLKASDDGDVLNLTYEAKNSDRIAEYDMKLMDIDADTLGIPDTEYDARVTMLASEFSRICRDLSMLGESVRIEVSKEGVRFASEGEAAHGSVLLKQTDAARKKYADYGKEDEEPKKEEDGEENAEDGVEDVEEGSSKGKKEKAVKVKKEKVKVKKEKVDGGDEDGDTEMKNGDDDADEEDSGEFKAKSDDEGEEEKPDDEDEDADEEELNRRKRKRAAAKVNGKPKKRTKKSSDADDVDAGSGVSIEMNQHVTLTFSLKYLVNFSKSAALTDTVQLMLSNDVPLLVSYKFGQGHIHYYLAPKIGDD